MARDFGKVRTAFWADDKVIAWPERLKFVALYLLTSPHTNAIGCFRVPLQYIAADTGLSAREAEAALNELAGHGFLSRCPKTSFIFLRKYLEHNGIENGKVGTHCIRLAATIPLSVPFLKDFEAALKAALALIGTAWEGFGYPIDTVSKPYRTPEPEPLPEPEPEPQPETEGRGRAARSATKASRWPSEAVVPEDWISEAEAKLSEHNRPPLDLRLEAEKFRNYWSSKAGGGATKTDWRATWFTWVLSDKNGGKSNGSGQHGRLDDASAVFRGNYVRARSEREGSGA